jgi:2-dehydro-3-deoxyphosphogluconate aldolase / (4S)-4-hydroxy-2-oxoglutarate aldolase
MKNIIKKIEACGIIPVIKLEQAEDAHGLGKALLQGGIPIAEITFRTQAAPDAIRLMRKEFPDLVVGAGTITKPEQVEAAVASGAQFAVTPGFNPRIIDLCIARGLPIIPGVNSPSQIELGLERGIQVLKFFPAEPSGGVKMLKALHGPYSEARFVPTGGIDLANLEFYLALPYVAAVGGSWMVKEELIANSRFDEIARLCQEARTLVAKCRQMLCKLQPD